MAAEPKAADRLRAVPPPDAEIEESYPAGRRFLRGLLYAVLLLSPLPFGSVQPWAVLTIELAAAVVGAGALAVLFGEPTDRRVPPLIIAIVAALLLLGALQVVPMGWGRTHSPGASIRAELADFVPQTAPATAPWSLAAPESVDASARFVAVVLLALGASVAFTKRKHRTVLAAVVVASALFQSVYGSAEYLSGRNSIFGYPKRHYLDSATGTFINRNHFAGYLAAALPLVFALASHFRSRRTTAARRAAVTGLATVVALTVWVGILLSRSRGGLFVAVAVTLAFAIVGRVGRRAATGLLAALVLALIVVTWRDVNIPADRLATVEIELASSTGRLAVWQEALAVTASSPWLGFGIGTFENALGAFAEKDLGRFTYDHAHNEYVQWGVELGVVGLILVACLVCVSTIETRQRRGMFARNPIARGFLLGSAAIGLHAMVDFGPRIPAIAVLLASLAAVPLSNSRERYHRGVETSVAGPSLG